MTKKRTNQILLILIAIITGIVMYSISMYQFYPYKNITYTVIVVVSLLSMLLLVKRKFLPTKMLLALLAAGGSAGLIVHSMVNGIEIAVGPKTGQFLFLKEQYGLINSKDAMLVIIIFILASYVIYSIKVKLQDSY